MSKEIDLVKCIIYEIDKNLYSDFGGNLCISYTPDLKKLLLALNTPEVKYYFDNQDQQIADLQHQLEVAEKALELCERHHIGFENSTIKEQVEWRETRIKENTNYFKEQAEKEIKGEKMNKEHKMPELEDIEVAFEKMANNVEAFLRKYGAPLTTIFADRAGIEVLQGTKVKLFKLNDDIEVIDLKTMQEKQDHDKISFAVERLEKLKVELHTIHTNGYLKAIDEEIDNQIKELKGE